MICNHPNITTKKINYKLAFYAVNFSIFKSQCLPFLPVQAVRDRVLATGQLLRALYKRLEEKILRTQKKELASRTQGLDPEILLPSTPKMKGVREPSKLRQQEEYVLSHLY